MRLPAALALLILLLAGCSDSGDDAPEGAGDGGAGAPSGSASPTTPGARPAEPAQPAQPCSPQTHEVVMRDNRFEPEDLTVCQGDTVHWTTEDPQAHNVVSTSGPAQFRSQDVSIIPIVYAQEYSYTFTASGTVDYLCEYHNGMVGTIEVTAA